MFSRRFAYLLLALVVAVLIWLRLERTKVPPPATTVEPVGAPAGPNPKPNVAAAPAPAAPSAGATLVAAAEFPLAAPLNAPNSTVSRDLEALSHILDAWRANFPREGNPVGDNHEIAGALAGDNPLQLVLIPKHHPALNVRGELCDRWGTPYRFHQLSGERMEIRSAGPDQKFGTADDAGWSPGS